MLNPIPYLILLTLLISSVSAGSKASAPPTAGSKAASVSPAPLDTARARKLYQDGDFEQGISILETALKDKQVVNHSDSVFVFKHLGVMYAANETTRERGKYYMLQLLTIEPTARIMDMYASDMIYMIFKNIQEEFAASHARLIRAQGLVAGNQASDAKSAEPQQEPHGSDSNPKSGSYKTYYWVGAAAAAVGIGAAIFVVTEEKKPETKNLQVQ